MLFVKIIALIIIDLFFKVTDRVMPVTVYYFAESEEQR